MASFVRIWLSGGAQIILPENDYRMAAQQQGHRCGEGCCPSVNVVPIFPFGPDEAAEADALLVGHTVVDEPAHPITEMIPSGRPKGLRHCRPDVISAARVVFNKPGWLPAHLRS